MTVQSLLIKKPEVLANGMSKIYYYTKEHCGAVIGMEDAPVTSFSCDMSTAVDGIVAGTCI